MNQEVGKRTAQNRPDHIARPAPELSFFDMAVDEIKAIFLEQFQAKVMVESTKEQIGCTIKDVVMRLPLWQEAAAKWVAQFENGLDEVEDVKELLFLGGNCFCDWK